MILKERLIVLQKTSLEDKALIFAANVEEQLEAAANDGASEISVYLNGETEVFTNPYFLECVKMLLDGVNVELVEETNSLGGFLKRTEKGIRLSWEISNSQTLVNMDEKDSLEMLVKKIEAWAVKRGIDKAEPSKQMLKVVEELGEVAAALAKNQPDNLKDGIGDTGVTLIILAQQCNMDFIECLQGAYNEIAGRTGETVNGVFIKSSDL